MINEPLRESEAEDAFWESFFLNILPNSFFAPLVGVGVTFPRERNELFVGVELITGSGSVFDLNFVFD